MPTRRVSLMAAGVGYLLLLVAIVLLLLHARERALAELTTTTAQAEWQDWREAAKEKSLVGPVKRQPIKSDEPPALVLLRDHFPVVMGGALLFGSLLYAALAIAVWGALSKSGRRS